MAAGFFSAGALEAGFFSALADIVYIFKVCFVFVDMISFFFLTINSTIEKGTEKYEIGKLQETNTKSLYISFFL